MRKRGDHRCIPKIVHRSSSGLCFSSNLQKPYKSCLLKMAIAQWLKDCKHTSLTMFVRSWVRPKSLSPATLPTPPANQSSPLLRHHPKYQSTQSPVTRAIALIVALAVHPLRSMQRVVLLPAKSRLALPDLTPLMPHQAEIALPSRQPMPENYLPICQQPMVRWDGVAHLEPL